MKTEHTPGPRKWGVVKGTSSIPDWYVKWRKNDVACIYTMMDSERPRAEHEANAKAKGRP